MLLFDCTFVEARLSIRYAQMGIVPEAHEQARLHFKSCLKDESQLAYWVYRLSKPGSHDLLKSLRKDYERK